MKIGFALEYSLGHVTHAQNLKRFLSEDATVDPLYVDIPFDSTPMPVLLRPVFRDNWSIRASLAAHSGLRPHVGSLSSCLFNTQVTSLFSVDIMRRVPSVVSLDATPIQYDSLGEFYKHAPGPALLERAKRWLNQRAFRAAARLVTWSQWTKDSLARDYGVDPAKVTVIAPGIDLGLWRVDRTGASNGMHRAPTFLFVGGDFERKGGSTLLDAFRKVRREVSGARLLVVTKTLPDGFDEAGIEVFRNMTPNTPQLRELYAQADVFAFPTLGDCLPLAVMEALAAGLPVITSGVGALGEAVTDGECGLVVRTGAGDSLADAMLRLASDSALRARMSEAAVVRAHERFDAAKNYRRLIDILKSLAAGSGADTGKLAAAPR